jgi:hypothetical protein
MTVVALTRGSDGEGQVAAQELDGRAGRDREGSARQGLAEQQVAGRGRIENADIIEIGDVASRFAEIDIGRIGDLVVDAIVGDRVEGNRDPTARIDGVGDLEAGGGAPGIALPASQRQIVLPR